MHRLLFCLFVAACSNPPQPPAQQTTSLPGTSDLAKNVILVTIDTLRADVLAPYGGLAKTPVLRNLAERGWLFERCISSSMLTNPSHASLMTSLYPRDHGVYDNESGVTPDVTTLAEVFANAGFATGAVIGFPHLNPSVSNLGQGFSQVIEAGVERRASQTSQTALALLDSLPSTKRFFMWIHYTDPHAPYEPQTPPAPRATAGQPMRVARAVAPSFQKNNPWFRRAMRVHKNTADLIDRYLAEVEASDAGLGILIHGLQQRGLLESTALAVTSDHGENLGEHRLYFHHGGLYDTTVHVPLIIASQSSTIAPKTVAGLVQTVDIGPTLAHLSGVAWTGGHRGESLRESMQHGYSTRALAFSEHMLQQQVAVRSPTAMMILHQKNSRQFPSYRFMAGRKEFYDLEHDSHQRTPLPHLWGEEKKLQAAIDAYVREGKRMPPMPAVAQDRSSLRALGYIE